MPLSTVPEWLLIFAGVNLALGAAIALLPFAHHGWTLRRLAVASVPILWAMEMAGEYLYLRATRPPPPVVMVMSHPDGVPLPRHGNYALIWWWERVGTATVLAFWLTVVTLLSLIAMWLAYSIHARSRRGGFA